MNRIVSILMQRDNLTLKEAEDTLNDVRTRFADCEYDPEECEEIMAEELGLELDYLFDVI